ncbi:MAG TPA: hypothetical protein VLM05_18855 [Mycobacteriales bacterium]|nr:hypothetical protein [Mycobacteriales bacterium]
MSRRAVLVLSTAGALAACSSCSSSSSDGPAALPPGPSLSSTAAAPTSAAPTTAAPTPASTTGTTRAPIRWEGPAATGAKAPVQQATQAYWSMVVRLAERPDPADPAIAALSVPPQREQLVTLFGTIRKQGLSQRGPIAGAVTVSTVSGSAATAATCLDQSLVRVYDKAGKARPGSSGSVQIFAVSLERTGGAWKVSNVADGGDCTLPDR